MVIFFIGIMDKFFQETLQESKFDIDQNNSPDIDDNDLLEPLTISNLWQEGKKL